MIPLIALLLLVAISTQVGAAVAKYMLLEVGSVGACAVRLFIAASILCLYWRPWRQNFRGKSWHSMVAFGIFLGLMNICLYLAFERIPLGIAVTLEFIGPVAVALLGSRRALDFVWVALVVFGLWMLMPSAGGSQLDLIGVLFALMAGFCWAMYIVLGRKSSAIFGEYTSTFGITVAAIMAVPAGVAIEGWQIFASPYLLALGFLVAILSTIVPYSIEMHVITKIPARVFSILMSLEPAIAALVGMLILREFLSFDQIVGISAIVLASLGVTLTLKSA